MRKRIILLTVLDLLTLSFVLVHNVQAQYISTDVQVTYGSLTPFVNQRVELTSTNSGGTPPYTYQWYMNDQPIQGGTTSTLEFIESTPGLYHISLGITDALGNYTLATFMGAFFIKVMALPTSSAPQNLTSTPTVTSTPTFVPTPTVPEFQLLTIPVLLGIIGYLPVWWFTSRDISNEERIRWVWDKLNLFLSRTYARFH